MRKSRKGIIILVLLSVFTLHASQNFASAEVKRYIHTKTASVQLNISDGNAVCMAYVKGVKKGTTISGKLVLMRVTNTTETVVKSWPVSSNTPSLNVCKTVGVSKGYYRLDLQAKVSCDGKSETVKRSSSAACI